MPGTPAPAPTWNGSVYTNTATDEYGPADTWQIGGSRFALFDGGAINPIGYGPVIQNAPYAVQSVPPSYGVSGTGAGNSALGSNSSAAALGQAAASNPWSPKQSPLPWIIVFAVAGVVYMDKVHWGK